MLTNSHILVAEGQNLITRSLVENKKINFLYYKAGNGDVNSIDAIKELKDISGALIKSFDVALISKISPSTTNISGQYDNTGMGTSQQVKEYGLFAKLEGDLTEVLFSYQGLGEGFILPAYSGTLITQIVDFTITMTQEVGIVVRFNPSALVDMQTFFEELDKKVDKTSIKNEQLTNTNTDLLSSSAARSLFENGAGGKCLGYIEDGGQHTPHDTDFWISKTLPGQFRCMVSNSDRYIDADKWLPIDDNSNASKLKNLDTKTVKYIDPIGLLLNNTSWDDKTDLNITTKPFQIAPIETPNTPNLQSFGVWTIKNGPNFGVQLAVSLEGEIYARGQNIGIWSTWKHYIKN